MAFHESRFAKAIDELSPQNADRSDSSAAHALCGRLLAETKNFETIAVGA